MTESIVLSAHLNTNALNCSGTVMDGIGVTTCCVMPDGSASMNHEFVLLNIVNVAPIYSQVHPV